MSHFVLPVFLVVLPSLHYSLPPPPPPSKGAVTRVVCPLGPPAYVDSSTATRVNNPGRPRGRAALRAPRGPSNRAANPPWDATQP